MMLLPLIFFILRIINLDATRTKLCPALTLPQHGFFFSGYCEREPGSLCGLGCLSGYRLVDGDSFRECQQDGIWTGQQLKCQEIRCPLLKINTKVVQECSPEQNSSDFKIGTKCQAKCSEIGYRLIGPHTRQCLILGIWSGYEQFCVVNNETTMHAITSTNSTQLLTTTTTNIRKYHDYSNFALSINKNDTGIAVSFVQPSQFTIIFWFYLENSDNASLVSLRENNDKKYFEIVVRQKKLVFYHLSRNQTQPTLIKIPVSKWNHFAWIYSNKIQQSYIYIDDISSLILFNQAFHGLVTRLEIWNEMLSEQKVLISYRDCRKQNGDIFSWSKVSDQIWIDINKLKSSSFCSGCTEPASIHGGIYHVSDYEVGSFVEYKCNYAHEMIGINRAYCMVPSEWYPLPPICKCKSYIY
ncbi:unnamed protein product [Rotaria sp. Silwood2]|nr:unnamed protein product [Rotaria sp. Silwood2]